MFVAISTRSERAAISLFLMNKWTSRAEARGQEVLKEWCEGATFGPCAPAEGPCQPGLPDTEGRMSNTLARGSDIEGVCYLSLLQRRCKESFLPPTG